MTSNTLKIGLAASLALNLFIIGAAVGAAGMQAKHAHRPAPQRAPSSANALMRAAEALPEARRAAYIARLNTAGEEAKKDSKAAREARMRASDLIAAPTFDQPAILALLAQARNIDQGSRGRFEETVIDFASTLTPEERKAFGARLKPPPPRNNKSDGKDGANREKASGSQPAASPKP